MTTSIKTIKLPNGKIITAKVDDSWSDAEVKAKLTERGIIGGPSIGPIPEGTQVPSGREETSQLVGESKPAYQLPYPGETITQEQGRAGLPIAGGIAGGMLGPAGMSIPAIAGQALLGGAGYTAGKLGQQALEGDIKPGEAVAEGGKYTAGAFTGGLAFKGISAIAAKAFSGGKGGEAIQFAKDEGIPYIGDPKLQGARLTLPGDIYVRKQAGKVTTAINRTIANFTKDIKSLDAADEAVDTAVAAGRQFFDDALAPGMTGIKEPLQKVYQVAGDAKTVPVNTLSALDDAVKQMASKQGVTSGPLYQRFATILKRYKEGDTFALKDLDELYGDIWRIWNTKANRSSKVAVDIVSKGIAKDIDGIAKGAGYMGFMDDFTEALSKREAFRELIKANPEFNKLLKIDPNKTRIWLNTLFSSGGKALKDLRTQNPEVYSDLSNAWLARHMWENVKPSPSGIGSIIDGKGFGSWVDANKQTLKEVFGNEKATSILSFGKYVEASTKMLSRVDQPISPTEFLTRGAGEIAALGYKPGIAIPSEGAALFLSYGLTNPNSSLFKVLTRTVPELPRTGKSVNQLFQTTGGLLGVPNEQ